jgi:hypothetical protein
MAIAVLGGTVVEDPNTGTWRTTNFDEADHTGILGDVIRTVAASYLAKESWIRF